MERPWKRAIERYKAEAVLILEQEYKLPTSYDELIKLSPEAGDYLLLNALLIIYGVFWLEKELIKGNCEGALDRMFTICDAYEQLSLLRDIPEMDRKVILTEELVKKIRRGYKVYKIPSNAGKNSAEARRMRVADRNQRILELSERGLNAAQIAMRDGIDISQKQVRNIINKGK